MLLLTEHTRAFEPMDTEIGQESEAGGRLGVIAKYVRRCQLCDLHINRRHAVPGEGSPAAGIMVVGEGPGDSEDAKGMPFVGRAGEVLDEILDAVSLSRPELFITNIVKCRPADRVGGKLHNRTPKTFEIEACRPYLVRQAGIIRPRVILCMGASAAKGVIETGFVISKRRGQWFEGPFGSRITATYHPAFLLRGGGPGLKINRIRSDVLDDLRKVRRYL